MNRRAFLGNGVAGGMMMGAQSARAQGRQGRSPVEYTAHGDLVFERPVIGKPHAGKVLVAIQPHCDDIPWFAAGTVAKLIGEGYTGYMIRVTNDDMAGPGTTGETVLANERDTEDVARALGLRKVYHLNYSNHRMDSAPRPELQARLIFLFRLLKADTVVSYDPWGHYEENPDHTVTAECVEAACWMAAGTKDFPEHFDAGLTPHAVQEKYYFARFQQRVNRVVDTSETTEQKISALMLNRAQGPAGNHGAELRASLAQRGLRLPVLGADDATANREYIRRFVLYPDAELGERYGVKYAEQFHYIGPAADDLTPYIKAHAVPL